MRFLLWCGAAVLVLASVGTIAVAWVRPYGASPPTNPHPSDATHPSNTPVQPLPELSAFERAWNLDLRRSLYDQPVPVAMKPAKRQTPSRLSARLAGTVIEPGHSVAMFITPGGKIELKSVGETMGAIKVLDITPEGVSVLHRGKKIDLLLDQGKQR